MKINILYIFILIAAQLNSQTYCLTITLSSNNPTSITYNWSLSVSEAADASIQIDGTGNLSGMTIIGQQAMGQPNAGPYTGSFTFNKIGMGSDFTYSTMDLGVFTRGNGTTMTSMCSPLPITLSSFSATKHSDRASKLDWTTSSEINSAYFGIERSRDSDNWETIAKVNAAGNSNVELAYEYIDDKLPFTRSKDNIFYYRIRLIDQDGTHKYSDIKGVNFSREVADGLISIYPNPATQMLHLDVSGLELNNVETKLNIFDMYGRSMLLKAITGSGLEPIDVQNYPAGVYNISVTQGDKLHQKQFIKID